MEMTKKDKFFWLSSQVAYITECFVPLVSSLGSVLTSPSTSRLCNFVYIPIGEQLTIAQKLGSVCDDLKKTIKKDILYM